MWHLRTLLFCIVSLVEGSIDEPNYADAPIRLSRPKPVTKPHHWDLYAPVEEVTRQSQDQPSPAVAEPTHQSNRPQHDARLEILEPPDKSFIAGKTFIVKLDIHVQPSTEALFKKAYEHDGHLCVSVDEGPYHCWNLDNAQILFNEVTDGNHTLNAKLYKDGKLQHETSSSEISFTMVHNPEFDDEIKFHNQNITSQDDVPVVDEEYNQEEGAQVSFPVVEVLSPKDRVSYTGNHIGIKTLLKPSDPEQFKKYFENSFTCINIDLATVHACYPIFDEYNDPLILGLNNGMHTMQASLMNPETGDLLDDSIHNNIFFMAGNANEGAHFVADINIRGKLHKVPIVQGGSLVEQAKYLCTSVGLTGSLDCLDPVYKHLTQVEESMKK